MGVEQGVDAVDGLGQQLVEADRAATLRPRLGDLEDLALGLVEHLVGATPLRVVGAVADLVADADQLTQGGALADDLRVGLDVGHRGGVLGQLAEIGQTAGLGQLPFLVQLLGQGDHVERLVALGQLVDGAEDQAVIVAIEVAIGDQIQHPLPGIVVQHQATDHGLFGLDGMRRHLEGGGFQIVLFGDADFVHGLAMFCAAERQRARLRRRRTCPMLTARHHRCTGAGWMPQAATTTTRTVASTSLCRCTATSYSPT
ncbi:hypothetical protein D3C80_722690 [compost metagenome]